MSQTVTRNVGFRSERGPILVALMVSMALVALDSTVLATSVPSIVRDLGGFASFPWLFSVYLLTQAIALPIYAKLSDVFGRKPVILVGIGIFLLGSILCGAAWNMPALIVFRAVQGLGAGAIQPTTSTIAGDIYTVEERAKAQGYLASVWGIAAVLGPAIGGLFSQFVTWRLIFLVNVPLCLLAGVLLIRNFNERVERQRHRAPVDYLGAALLTAGMTLIILAVLEGGQAWAWVSVPGVGCVVLGATLLAAFVLVERGIEHAVLPLWVFGRRLLLTTTLVSLGVGATLIGLSSYVPTFLEGSIGTPPILAGLAVAAQSIGWPITAALAGRIYLRIGFRNTALIGVTVVIAGAAALYLASHAPNAWTAAACCFVIGSGLGLMSTPTLVAAQSAVEWGQRGVATGTNMLARAIGSSVGVAAFGAVANAVIADRGGSSTSPTAIVASAGGVFAAVLLAAVLTLLAAVAMPRTPAPTPDR